MLNLGMLKMFFPLHKCSIILCRTRHAVCQAASKPTRLVFQCVASEASIVVHWWAPFQSERVQTRVYDIQKGRRPWD